MEKQIAEQVTLGALALVVGALGWLLLYEWNLLRLRRGLSRLFPEHINRVFPKIAGTILVVIGVCILVGTAIVGRFQ